MKKKQAKKHVTFAEILNDIGEKNANRLMEKAREFSRLAKSSSSKRQANIAYQWKNRCLKQLLQKCNKYTCLTYDDGSCRYKGLSLVHLKTQKYGLHTHPNWLNQN